MAAEKFCCPVTLLFFGILFLWQGVGNKNKVDKIQGGLVDALFIEGDDVSEEDCNRWGNVLQVTCEKKQAENYKKGNADQTGKGGKPKGLNVDLWLYSVAGLR